MRVNTEPAVGAILPRNRSGVGGVEVGVGEDFPEVANGGVALGFHQGEMYWSLLEEARRGRRNGSTPSSRP